MAKVTKSTTPGEVSAAHSRIDDFSAKLGKDHDVLKAHIASLTEERDELAAQLAAEPIERTAIVMVGRALAAEEFRESALYDADYQRRFRGRGS